MTEKESSLSRRNVLKASGALTGGLAGVTGLSGITLAKPSPPPEEDPFPKTYYDTREYQEGDITPYEKSVVSAGIYWDHLTTEYAAGAWRWYYLLDAGSGSVNYNREADEAIGSVSLQGPMDVKAIEQNHIKDIGTDYADTSWGVGVTGGKKGDVDLNDTIYKTVETLAAHFAYPVSLVVTAQTLVDTWQKALKETKNVGIEESFSLENRQTQMGHYMHYRHVIPPTEQTGSRSYDVKIADSLKNLHEDDFTHETYWLPRIPAYGRPSNMSTSEQKKYGIKKIHPEESMSVQSNDASVDDTVYRAEHPTLILRDK